MSPVKESVKTPAKAASKTVSKPALKTARVPKPVKAPKDSGVVTDVVFITTSTVDARRFRVILDGFGFEVRPMIPDGPAPPRGTIVYFTGLTDAPEKLLDTLDEESWRSASLLLYWPETEDKPYLELFRRRLMSVVQAVRGVPCGDMDQ